MILFCLHSCLPGCGIAVAHHDSVFSLSKEGMHCFLKWSHHLSFPVTRNEGSDSSITVPEFVIKAKRKTSSHPGEAAPCNFDLWISNDQSLRMLQILALLLVYFSSLVPMNGWIWGFVVAAIDSLHTHELSANSFPCRHFPLALSSRCVLEVGIVWTHHPNAPLLNSGSQIICSCICKQSFAGFLGEMKLSEWPPWQL